MNIPNICYSRRKASPAKKRRKNRSPSSSSSSSSDYSSSEDSDSGSDSDDSDSDDSGTLLVLLLINRYLQGVAVDGFTTRSRPDDLVLIKCMIAAT